MKAAHGKGHTLKHTRRHVKHHHKGIKHHPRHHHATATKHAHHVHTKAKHASHAKAKGLALTPGDVACCTIEALAASLLSQGLPVTSGQILELFQFAGGDEDKGMPVRVAFEAAAEFGLGGFRLARFESAWPCVVRGGAVVQQATADETLNLGDRELLRDPLGHQGFNDARAAAFLPAARELNHVVVGDVGAFHGSSLILGLDLPGQHAVLATPEGWWSWGQFYCPWCEWPDAVIDEAWAIAWA